MKFASPVPAPGKRAAVALALTVHLLLAAFLFYGIRWQSQPPEAVEVELVRAAPEPPQVQPPPPQAEPLPEPRPEPIPEAKPEPKVEAKPLPPPPPPPKPEIAIKEKPKPKPKPAKETPVPVKPKYDPFQKQLEEELKQTAERKTTEAVAQELAQLKAAQAAAAVSRAQRAWQDNIAAKIKGNIVRPANATGNPEAIFEVSLLPDGSLVGEPKLKKSTGAPALDAAIERAIKKSDPLPKPVDPSVFQRVLTLKFRPLEDQ